MISRQSDAGPLCFVIGPIGKHGTPERKHADLLLNSVIKHVLAADEFGYRVKRADEDADPGMIGDRIVMDIISAPLVVADLTDLNANAFYELGIRHSTEKPTIHVAKSGTPLPFDNISHRTIFVDLTDWNSIQDARERLQASALAIKEPGYRVSNPITQANASFRMRESADPMERVVADLRDRMAHLEFRLSDSEEAALMRMIHPEEAYRRGVAELQEFIRARAAAGISPLQIADDVQHWGSVRHLRVHRTVVGLKGNFEIVVDGRPMFRFNGQQWELPLLDHSSGSGAPSEP